MRNSRQSNSLSWAPRDIYTHVDVKLKMTLLRRLQAHATDTEAVGHAEMINFQETIKVLQMFLVRISLE